MRLWPGIVAGFLVCGPALSARSEAAANSGVSADIAKGIPNLRPVDAGIWRGGQPTEEGWLWLKNHGVTNVVKLNYRTKRGDSVAEKLGMHVVYEPIDFRHQFLGSSKFMPQVANAVGAITPGTFVHCEHGEDRTGLVIACYRVRKNGYTKAKAQSEMLALGFHKELEGLWGYWKSFPEAK